MAYKYLVPSDTRSILDKLHADTPEKNVSIIHKCQNLALILARYIPEEAIEKANVPNERNKKVHDVWLSQLLKDFNGENLEKLIFANLDRWSAMIQARDISAFQMTLRSRMVVGLGGKNPLEFGITLDKLTGLPYIPGSALKGLARSYALLTLAAYKKIPITPDKASDNNEKTPLQIFEEELLAGEYNSEPDDKKFPAKYYRLVFGTQEEAGRCIFFDAVVSNVANPEESLFTMDVMTPHFVYTSGGTPNDGDNPNPVSYVVVREGISFGFAIGVRKRECFEDEDNAIRKQARTWLRSALIDMGIGAKTAQGYGIFAKPE